MAKNSQEIRKIVIEDHIPKLIDEIEEDLKEIKTYLTNRNLNGMFYTFKSIKNNAESAMAFIKSLK